MPTDKGAGRDKTYQTKKPDGVNHLLVIAIGDYENGFTKLHNCINDAERLVHILTEKYRFEDQNVTKLYDKQATKDKIWEALHSYRKTVKPVDSLFIYFSGHGDIDGFRGFWIPIDAQKGIFSHYFSSDDIRHELNAIPAFHIVLIADACFSGSIFNFGISKKGELPDFGTSNDKDQSRWGLTASTTKEVAYDSLRIGENSSPFTGALINNLEKYRSDTGFLKIAADVHDDVRRITEGKQNPVHRPLNVEGDHQGQFVFRLKGQNTFTDPRDLKVYRTVEINGLIWMADNLDYDVGEGCWYYLDNPNIGISFGRLYTWDAAMKACPPGWRLPTDKEWRGLAKAFGGFYEFDTEVHVGDPKKGYRELFKGGSSGFSALLGGYRYDRGDDDFGRLGVDGNYWSATEYGSDNAWSYHFLSSVSELFRISNRRSHGFSCRCVQELSI
jgi:uncharacterized protein (TIGR02145 family)